ncbi:MAG: beta-L-arabinofuranosidase domain-containing protein, partial [Polyangiaceae bacterium]
PQVKDASKGRLELDVATGVSGADTDQDEEVPLTSVGLEGFYVTREDGKSAAIAPGEIVTHRLFRQVGTTSFSRDKIVALLASRAGVSEQVVHDMRAYRFRADVHVENASHDGALPVLRGMVQDPPDVTPERLLAAVRRGADYLCRVMNGQGRYVYMYRPLEDKDETTYGMLRHAGSTYALLEAYGELRTPDYLDKAELALRYLAAHLKDDPASQGKYAVDTFDEEQQRSGGAGLALVAFAEHAAVTGKREWLETMRALARFILKQQFEDGHFRSNADLERPGAKKLKREPIYYQGEAALGLVRLYAIDPQEFYLDAARRAADWVVRVRDAVVSEDNQEHDHWITYALNELYRVTRDRSYLEHAYKIARAIHRKQRTPEDSPAPDLVGTFYNGETTPASTRLEAYAADVALARFAGEPDAWLLGPAREVARSVLGQQYTPENDYWVRNPGKTDGGVRESLFVPDVRIDYVQHAMSGWLHLARELRDPVYGKTGIPSQDPPHDAVQAPAPEPTKPAPPAP